MKEAIKSAKADVACGAAKLAVGEVGAAKFPVVAAPTVGAVTPGLFNAVERVVAPREVAAALSAVRRLAPVKGAELMVTPVATIL